MLRGMVKNGNDISAYVPEVVAKTIAEKKYYVP
jgi:phosphopantetheine adenylyltransferase